MVITGDLKQSDLSAENGLRDLIDKLDKYKWNSLAKSQKNQTLNEFPEGIRLVNMSMDDVERSPIVKQVLALYELSGGVGGSGGSSISTPSISTPCLDAALIPKHHLALKRATPWGSPPKDTSA